VARHEALPSGYMIYNSWDTEIRDHAGIRDNAAIMKDGK
jgi:hypothetical protein